MTNNPFEGLIRLAQKQPNHMALIEAAKTPGTLPRQWTYAEIVQEVSVKIGGLRALELKPHSRIGILTRPSLDIYALAFACQALGHTPVFFDPLTCPIPSHLDACETTEGLILNSFFEPQAWRLWLSKKLFTLNEKFPTIQRLSPHRDVSKLKEFHAYSSRDLVACCHISSQKYFQVNYQQSLLQHSFLQTHWRSQANEVDLVFSPLLVMANLREGLTSVLGALENCASLSNLNITRIKASCEEAKLVGSNLHQLGIHLQKLHSIFLCGQKLSQKEAQILSELYTNVQSFYCFGLSDVEPLTMVSISEIQTAPAVGFNVGSALGNIQIKILPPEQEVANKSIDELYSQEGEIVVSADHLSEHVGLGTSFEDSEGNLWIRTGFLGYFGPEQNLFVIGRLQDQIQIGTRSYPVELLEQQFENIPGVKKAALIADANKPHLYLTTNPEVDDKNDVEQIAQKYGLDFKIKNMKVHFIEDTPSKPSPKSEITT